MHSKRWLSAKLFGIVTLATGLIGQSLAQPPEINIDYQRYTLDNGLTLIVHEDNKAPVVAVSIWYHVGSKNEPEGQTGFAHLFEHLMFNGTENYDGEWFEPLQSVGGTSLNGTTWLDRTNYFQTVPTPALDLVLWMESDRMGHLLGAVTQEKLDNQRGVVQNEKRQGDNAPYGRVNYNLYEGLFPEGHPYHHSTIGSMEDLNAASLEDVQQWFRDYYGPNNAVLVIAGDVDPQTALEKVTTYFGDIPPGPEVDAASSMIPVREHNTHEIQYDEVPSVLANRVWAVPDRSTREKALLDLVAFIMGQGNNSRLYRDLVYDKQVASSVATYVSPFELTAVFDLAVTLNPGVDASIASESMDRLFAEFLEDGPTKAELERVVNAINASTIRGLEQVNGLASMLAEGELYSDDPLFVQQYLDWINSATADDVLAVARKWLGDGWHQVDVLPTRDFTLAGEGVDRSGGLPALPTERPSLTFPEIQTATLSNGLEVVLAERHALPLINLSMQFDAGYAADANGILGVSSFAMSMLELGTRSRDALEIAEETETLGAQMTSASNLDRSFVSVSTLKGNLEDSMDLWADVIRNAVFDEEEIERLRGRWLAGIQQEKAEPLDLALRLLPPVLYGEGHAYAVPFTGTGTATSINSITRDDLQAFRATWLRPDNGKLFIVGDTTLEEITPLLEKAFRGWDAPDSPLPVKDVSLAPLSDSSRLVLIDKPDSPQSLILAGHLAPGPGDDRNLAIEAMNEVLGGSFTSRANMNLREDKGWAYGVQTLLYSASGQRPFLVYAPVQSDRTGDSISELLGEMRGIQLERPVEQLEMDRVISGETRGLPGQFQTASAVLGSLVSSDRYGRPLDYAATLTERYSELDLQDLQEVTDVVQPDSLTWLIVGDVSVIREQVEALGIAPVEIWDVDGNRLE